MNSTHFQNPKIVRICHFYVAQSTINFVWDTLVPHILTEDQICSQNI
jgi:hypothetical protein